MSTLYVIEKRDSTGRLDFVRPQPEDFFGVGAITGISEDDMAKVVFAHCPTAVLDGRNLPLWPAYIDAGFIARRKTW